jgi:hypothetical protein
MLLAHAVLFLLTVTWLAGFAIYVFNAVNDGTVTLSLSSLITMLSLMLSLSMLSLS